MTLRCGRTGERRDEVLTASAPVPLLLERESSAAVRTLLESDAEVVAWWGSAVEWASVAARLRREERLTVEEKGRVLDLSRRLRAPWLEVLQSAEVRAVELTSGRAVGRAGRDERRGGGGASGGEPVAEACARSSPTASASASRRPLERVACPMLLTGSRADALIPSIDDDYAALAARLTDARILLDDAGDHPFMWTRPEVFMPAAVAFLAEAEVADGEADAARTGRFGC